MIERFNFFDLYGYLLPGIFLIMLAALPFGVLDGSWTPAGLSDGLAIILLLIGGYVAGVLLQEIARTTLPSAVYDGQAGTPGRTPSQRMLDRDDSGISMSVRERLLASMNREGWDFDPDKELSASEREDIFRFCRSRLVHEKKATYVEQYQGMYTLTRGVAAALLATAPYYMGWALAGFVRTGAGAVPHVGLVLLLPAAVYLLWTQLSALRREQNLSIAAVGTTKYVFGGRSPSLGQALVAIGLWAAGCQAATTSRSVPPEISWCLAAASLIAMASALRFRKASLHYMRHFAASVYRDFVATASGAPASSKHPDEGAQLHGPVHLGG